MKYDIFKNFSENEKRKVISIVGAKELFYKKGQTITYAMKNRFLIGVMISGEANMIRYDYTGDRTIVEEISTGDIFSDMFISNHASELSVEAVKDSEIIFLSYGEIIKKCETSQYALSLLDNLFTVMSQKIIKRNERIDYLAIDRSAMMRELKNLKEDRLIKDVNKKITLLF